MARIALFLIFFTFISIKLCFAGQSCKKLPPSAPIDPKWFTKALENGFYVYMASKLDLDQDYIWNPTKEFMKDYYIEPFPEFKRNSNLCAMASVKIPAGMFNMPYLCKFAGSQRTCQLDGSQYPEIGKALQYIGNFTFGKSDNSSYLISFGCINSIDSWLILTTQPTLPDSLKEEALNFIEGFGYETDANACGNPDNSDFWVYSYKKMDCPAHLDHDGLLHGNRDNNTFPHHNGDHDRNSPLFPHHGEHDRDSFFPHHGEHDRDSPFPHHGEHDRDSPFPHHGEHDHDSALPDHDEQGNTDAGDEENLGHQDDQNFNHESDISVICTDNGCTNNKGTTEKTK